MRVPNGTPRTKPIEAQNLAPQKGRDSELDPCLALKGEKAAAEDARFGAISLRLFNCSAKF
jgi:hypothetical protein